MCIQKEKNPRSQPSTPDTPQNMSSMTSYAPITRMTSMDPVDELLGYNTNHYELPAALDHSMDNFDALISGMENSAQPEMLDLWGTLAPPSMTAMELGSLNGNEESSAAVARSPPRALVTSSASSPKDITSNLVVKTSPGTKRPKKVARKPAAFPLPLPVAKATVKPATPPPADGDAPATDESEQLTDALVLASEGASADDGLTDDEKKRAERMMRNRASAAESRKRKRAHVDELEAQVAQLHAAVATLTAENATLKAQIKGASAGLPGNKGTDFELPLSELSAELPPDELPMLVSFPSANLAPCA